MAASLSTYCSRPALERSCAWPVVYPYSVMVISVRLAPAGLNGTTCWLVGRTPGGIPGSLRGKDSDPKHLHQSTTVLLNQEWDVVRTFPKPPLRGGAIAELWQRAAPAVTTPHDVSRQKATSLLYVGSREVVVGQG
jgi:hypothetical protein